MKWRQGLIVLIMLLTAWLLDAAIARADGPTPPDATQIAQRLQEEPQLYCFAQWIGAPPEAMAIGKLQFDYQFGYQNRLTTMEQWRATWSARFQSFADWLGVPNPVGSDTCNRQIDALRRLGVVKDNPVWIKP
jgi:hypothetical protein